MKSLCPLIVFAAALMIATTSHAQVVQFVPPASYVAPPYVAPQPFYVSPPATYVAPTYPVVTQPYVTRYAYAPPTTVTRTYTYRYPYQTWVTGRPIYYYSMRPAVPVRTYFR
jgi:hypothetical protein